MTPVVEPIAVKRSLRGLRETQALAARLAALSRRGDVVALSGDLGAGKTAFARAFIEARGDVCGIDVGEVPSPTFTLVQVYELPDCPVFHFDLYRLERAEEAFELGLDDAVAQGISLIEWPERLGDFLPPDRLDLALAFSDDPDARRAELTGGPAWTDRLQLLAGDD